MYKQGDILLIPIPFSDLSFTKQRPVLVLSNSAYNISQHDVVVAAITSNLTERAFFIHLTSNDLEQGQLKVDSGIRTDKIYTLSQQIVIKKFGQVNQTILSQVKEKINELLTE